MPDTKPLRKPILRNSSQRLSYGRKTAFLDLAELRTERKIISTIESLHSGKVIDTYQIVERKQSSYRSLLLHRYNLLTSQQQRSPPNGNPSYEEIHSLTHQRVLFLRSNQNRHIHIASSSLTLSSKHVPLSSNSNSAKLFPIYLL